MGTVLAQSIVETASLTLRDPQGRRWTASELLRYLNDGQREIGIMRVDSCTERRSIAMVAGAEQTLPTDCIRLIEITHNMGAAPGTTVGEPIRLIDRDELDSTAPSWRTAAAQDVVIHYVYDGRVPKSWDCYPPQLSGGRYVRAAVQVIPVNCTINGVDDQVTSTAIAIDDIYQTALQDYIIYRAYDKNDQSRNVNESQRFYARLLQRLGIKGESDLKNDPNKNAPPAQQSRQAGGVSARARPNG